MLTFLLLFSIQNTTNKQSQQHGIDIRLKISVKLITRVLLKIINLESIFAESVSQCYSQILSTHTTSFQRPYYVVKTLWMLYKHWNDAVYLELNLEVQLDNVIVIKIKIQFMSS